MEDNKKDLKIIYHISKHGCGGISCGECPIYEECVRWYISQSNRDSRIFNFKYRSKRLAAAALRYWYTDEELFEVML